jgi:hypothetical protein
MPAFFAVALPALAALLVLTASGCGSGPGTESSQSSTPRTTQAQRDRHIRTAKPKPEVNKPRKVTVPDLVGQSESSAVAELKSHGLHAYFSNSGPLLCAKPIASSTVVSELPQGGDQVRAGRGVLLSTDGNVQTGCGSATAPRSCDPSDLSLRVTQGMPDFTGGSEQVLVGVDVEHVGKGPKCSVDSPIKLSIDRQGVPVNFRGNPASLQLHAALDSGERMIAGWVFGGWCGPADRVVARASVDGLSAEKELAHLRKTDLSGCPTLGLYSLYAH